MTDLKTAIIKIMPVLPEKLASAIEKYPEKERIEEIRLRCGQPFCITAGRESYFLCEKNRFERQPSGGEICLKSDIERTVKLLCNNSVYAHMSEINSGYIPAPHGCRAGVSGNFSGENLCEFSSVNIRIAHEIIGAADMIVQKYIPGGILIAGPPSSGKTTILRDLVRQLSGGAKGKYYRISVIDTRGEITGYASGEPSVDIGRNSDVFFGGDRPKCIEIALRVFAPEIICFDEIGTRAELAAVRQSFNAGADIITTAHAGSIDDFKSRPVLRQLLLCGAVKTVVLLRQRGMESARIFESEELIKCLGL